MQSTVTSRPGGPLLAILSAVLFGASTPLAKLLLGDGVNAWLLAGLLYLGSGVGLAVIYGWQRAAGRSRGEAPLRRSDLPWLALVVLAGGVAGPVLLMYGLTRLPASSAALLLNLEAIATLGLAWIVFREHVDRKLLLGAAAIVAGAVLLSWQPGALHIGIGAAAIAGACLAWGVDNNLTRKLSSADPVQIAMIKGLVAGSVNLGLALLIGARLPGGMALAGAGLVGFFGYGASLVLFVLALRYLGAARTGAYFSTAPFLGTVLAVLLLTEPVTLRLIAAGILMAVGVYLHLAERHEHEHEHEAMAHEHRHRHDAEHQHEHAAGTPPGEPHSHWHTHAPIVHSHPHYPDLHHRHGHGPKAG
jgi:drug/metabolite transporter (DMT)-like permease